jgi:hypothetical protein
MGEQTVPDELQHFLFAPLEAGFRAGPGVAELLDDRRGGKIEHDQGHDGNIIIQLTG